MTFEDFPKVPKNYRWEKDEKNTQVVLLKKTLLGWKEVHRQYLRGVTTLPAEDKLYFIMADAIWRVYKAVNKI